MKEASVGAKALVFVILTSIAFAGGYFLGLDGDESSPIHMAGGKSSPGKEKGADGISPLGSVVRKDGSGSSTFAPGADRPRPGPPAGATNYLFSIRE